jgi:tetratricopeptide (TPR) repeat protein
MAYAKARGLTEMLEALRSNALGLLTATGEFDEALTLIAEMVPVLEASGDVSDLSAVRASQAEVLAMRGRADETVAWLDWLEASGRAGSAADVGALGCAASARLALGQPAAAIALLSELESVPGARADAGYFVSLPMMVRTAVVAGDPELAERLVTGFERPCPYAEHALVAANAALTEARGDLRAAADAYADAADRWDRFAVVPERAFALLGQGRCLLGLSRHTEAAAVLQHARDIFELLGAAPALAETNVLLASPA